MKVTFSHYRIGWEYAGTAPCKLVLLALADHADKNGYCWPGLTRLSDMTGLHRSTVMRRLIDLERAGRIICTRRRGRTTRYQLVAQCDPSQSATSSTELPDPSQSATTPVAECDPTSSTVLPEPITEPVIEPSNEPTPPVTFEDVD